MKKYKRIYRGRMIDLVVKASLKTCIEALGTIDRHAIDRADLRIISTSANFVSDEFVMFKITHWIEGGHTLNSRYYRPSGMVAKFEGTMQFDPNYETTTIYGGITFPAPDSLALYVLMGMLIWQVITFSYGGNSALADLQGFLGFFIIFVWIIVQSRKIFPGKKKLQSLDLIQLLQNAMKSVDTLELKSSSRL